MTLLIDPTACERITRALAARPTVGDGTLSVVLVDATLNRASGWGAGMLDAAESALAGPDIATPRDVLNPLDVRPGELWVTPLVERHDAIVMAAGDCLTCTSRAARNLVIAEQRGLPGALVCTGGAEEVARAVAMGLGLPALHVFPVNDSLFGLSRSAIAEAVRPAVKGLDTAIVRRATTEEAR